MLSKDFNDLITLKIISSFNPNLITRIATSVAVAFEEEAAQKMNLMFALIFGFRRFFQLFIVVVALFRRL